MRKTVLLVSLLLGAGVAQAQVVSPLGGSSGTPAAPPAATQKPPATGATATPAPSASTGASSSASSGTSASTSTHHRMTMQQRFEAANTTHDGKLTLDQARAGHMRSVVRDFDKIDATKAGYVTIDQIKAYQAKARAERRAQRNLKPASSQ